MKSQEAQMQRNRSFEVHAGWGAAVALAALLFGMSPVMALLIACAAGVAVEALQWAVPATGSATVEDAIYTGLGGLAGALLGVLA
jgi:glycopeptide antibiotics resistance protein